MIESHLLSIGGKPDDQANDEDEDEDNEALGDGTADHEVVPAHVGPRLGLDILLHHLAPSSEEQAWWQPKWGWGQGCLQSAAFCHTYVGRLEGRRRLPTNQYSLTAGWFDNDDNIFRALIR